jgi:hypothetical protein
MRGVGVIGPGAGRAPPIARRPGEVFPLPLLWAADEDHRVRRRSTGLTLGSVCASLQITDYGAFSLGFGGSYGTSLRTYRP